MTEEGAEHLRKIRALSLGKQVTGPRDYPECSTYHCHEKNQRKRDCCWKTKGPHVLSDWKNGMSNRDIAAKYIMAMSTLRKWQAAGLLPKRKLLYSVC